MSMFRKAMDYLGLVDDEDTSALGNEDDYGDEDAGAMDEAPPVRRGPSRRPTRDPQPTVRAMPRNEEPSRVPTEPGRRSVPARNEAQASIRTMPATTARVHVVEPRSFNDAQAVGDRLKSNQPVLLNLQGVDRELQRRLIDFASGATFALAGSMTRVADQVFLISPSDVEISAEERTRLESRGLMNR